jgi:hypothetical protein
MTQSGYGAGAQMQQPWQYQVEAIDVQVTDREQARRVRDESYERGECRGMHGAVLSSP